MAKANIKTSSGTTIVVNGTDTEVARIISMLKEDEGDGSQSRRGKSQKAKKVKAASVKAKFNATDGILGLREEGFFNKQKTLLDIKRALDEQGLIYPVTTLSGVVLRQVRKRNLRRIKEKKSWVYVKGSNV